MVNLNLDEKDIEKEKEVIIEERKRSNESDPGVKFISEAVSKALFLYSGYSYPIIGYLDQIKNCTQESIRKHYKKYYIPRNAFVLFTGDITLKEAVEKTKKYFGNIPEGKEIVRDRVVEPKNTGLKCTIDHRSDQLSTHSLSIIFKIDKDMVDTVKKLGTIEIAAQILSEGGSSVLYQNIVDKKGLAYSVEDSMDTLADATIYNITTTFRENQTRANVENEVMNIIHNFADQYLTPELFKVAKKKIMDRFEMMEDDPRTMHYHMVYYVGSGYSIEELRDIKNIINSIKFEDIKNTAKKLLNKENVTVITYSHPKKKG
jgi:predicted Zn-dependent peptidase